MMILKGGLVRTMAGEAPFIGDVAIENGKIVAIGPSITREGAEVHDVAGKYVMPGIVDAHSHLGLFESGTRELDLNEKMDPVSPQLRGYDSIFTHDIGVYEARSFGVTTSAVGPGSANVISGTFCAVKSYGSTVEEMMLKPCIAMKMALGENPKFIYSSMGKSPKTRMGSAALIRKALFEAIDYKQKKEKGTASFDFRMEALLPVINREIPVKVHCHRADDIDTAIRLMDEFNLRYTLEHCTEGYLIPGALREALKKNCEGIIIGPMMLRKGKLESRHAIGTKLGKFLYDEGIPFALCSDWAEISHEMLLLSAARLVAEGLPEEEAFNAITIRAAEYIGVDDRVGSLEVGKDADIAIYTGNPFCFRSVCDETYINGKLVYKRGESTDGDILF